MSHLHIAAKSSFRGLKNVLHLDIERNIRFQSVFLVYARLNQVRICHSLTLSVEIFGFFCYKVNIEGEKSIFIESAT